MGSSTPQGYNADEKAAERARRTVTVDGVEYRPRKKTGRLVKEILEMTPDRGDDEDKELTKDEQKENIDLLYKQVAVLLRDENGHSPDPLRLLGEAEGQHEDDGLDLEDARDLMAFLMPGDQQAAKDGQPGNVVALRG